MKDKTKLCLKKKIKWIILFSFQVVFLDQKTLVGQTRSTGFISHHHAVSLYAAPSCDFVAMQRPVICVSEGRLADTAATSQEWEVEKCCRYLKKDLLSPLPTATVRVLGRSARFQFMAWYVSPQITRKVTDRRAELTGRGPELSRYLLPSWPSLPLTLSLSPMLTEESSKQSL